MPYCPKCDMEFVEGVTICTDCGRPLYESKEAAEAAMAGERAKERAREKAMYEEYLKSFSQEADTAEGEEPSDAHPFGAVPSSGDALPSGDVPPSEDSPTEAELRALQTEAIRKARSVRPSEPVHAYVDKSQKYDDLKSSASAFLLVGGIILVVSILCWIGVIRIPMAPVAKTVFQVVLTAIGVFSLIVYANTIRSAKKLAPQIEEEKQQTEDIIEWFLSHYTADGIDAAITKKENLGEEELSLKRFQLIQDYLITGKDLPDPSYVDELCEEIYTKLYET